MSTDPFMIIDWRRFRVFDHLATACRPLRAARARTDSTGVRWRWLEVGESALGLTWLGPGRVWDVEWTDQYPDELARARADMEVADRNRHRAEFAAIEEKLPLGGHTGCVLFAIHLTALRQKNSLLTIADEWLSEAVWGRNTSTRPRHWRTVLMGILRGLCWLHIADRDPDARMPKFGMDTVLLTHAGDLHGVEGDECLDGCPCAGTRHHHFQIDLGPGFLGALEQLGRGAGDGIRTYQFPTRTRSAKKELSLVAIGKTGRLRSVFVPALLGEPEACRCLTASGHRILQALIRETTRPLKRTPKTDPRAEVRTGNRIKNYTGKGTVACALLDKKEVYVGFNGNGKRRGMGFRLTGDWRWPTKAGYTADEVTKFLDDLVAVVEVLDLTVVGVGPSSAAYSLSQLRGLSASPVGLAELSRIDVRIFARSGYVEQWSALFGWSDTPGEVRERPELDIRAELRVRKMSVRQFALALDHDPSFISKILAGKKRWPRALLKRARVFLSDGPRTEAGRTGAERTQSSVTE